MKKECGDENVVKFNFPKKEYLVEGMVYYNQIM